MQSQGITVTSEDGYPEYFAEAIKMQRGKWDSRWTAKTINNYIRTGFGMPEIQDFDYSISTGLGATGSGSTGSGATGSGSTGSGGTNT
jgi:hypothetical protein